jgi:hypothetical protein
MNLVSIIIKFRQNMYFELRDKNGLGPRVVQLGRLEGIVIRRIHCRYHRVQKSDVQWIAISWMTGQFRTAGISGDT